MTTTKATKAATGIDAALEAAARRMGFRDLEVRGSDRADFREVGVEAAREALRRAYDAGFGAGAKAARRKGARA